MPVNAEFPEALGFLFEPHRYKVVYGGRGSGKSWSFARALLLQGVSQRLCVLCTREVQKSLKDSVHKLLSNQIQELGLGKFYEVLDTVIRGRNGTEFIFAGLSGQTAESIKSVEGCNRVWVEEAQTVSKESWDILVPTIRAPGSEIWVSFNPVLESDATYQKFVINPPPSAKVVWMNYYQNPWFPQILEDERLHCEATEDFDTYSNIWEGTCRAAVAGAIYAKQVAIATIEGRICRVPYDPRLKVHTIWDLGFADNMAIIMAQRSRSEVLVVDYMQVSQWTTEQCVLELKRKPYNWGRDFLPHDGFNNDRRGKSDAQILKGMGRRVYRIPKTSVEDRIKNGRTQFHRFVFDKERCDVKDASLLECLKRYRRADSRQDLDTSPLHDQFSHGADVYGYAAQVIEEMINEDEFSQVPAGAFGFEPMTGSMGY